MSDSLDMSGRFVSWKSTALKHSSVSAFAQEVSELSMAKDLRSPTLI